MYRFAYAAALTLLVGCGLSESKFQDESLTATCQWLVDCFQMYDTVDACTSSPDMQPTDMSACTYDSKSAKTCLDGLQALTCDSTASDIPSACNDVYTCTDTTM